MTTDMTPAVAPDDVLVYIRALDEHELRTLLPANAIADIEHPDDMFSVVTADGVRLAIVEGREEPPDCFHARRRVDPLPEGRA